MHHLRRNFHIKEILHLSANQEQWPSHSWMPPLRCTSDIPALSVLAIKRLWMNVIFWKFVKEMRKRRLSVSTLKISTMDADFLSSHSTFKKGNPLSSSKRAYPNTGRRLPPLIREHSQVLTLQSMRYVHRQEFIVPVLRKSFSISSPPSHSNPLSSLPISPLSPMREDRASSQPMQWNSQDSLFPHSPKTSKKSCENLFLPPQAQAIPLISSVMRESIGIK